MAVVTEIGAEYESAAGGVDTDSIIEMMTDETASITFGDRGNGAIRGNQYPEIRKLGTATKSL